MCFLVMDGWALPPSIDILYKDGQDGQDGQDS